MLVDKDSVEREALSSLGFESEDFEFHPVGQDGFMDETDEPGAGRVLVGDANNENSAWLDGLLLGTPDHRVKDDWVTDEDDPVPPPATPDEAKRFLRMFFVDRSMHYGGPIPERELLIPRHIEMVLRLELSDCIDIFYASLGEHGIKEQRTRIELFFALQKESHRIGVPRHRSGGLLLVWLRLCRGWEV